MTTATTLRVRIEPDGKLGVETIDGRWLALKETGDANPTNTLKYMLMQAGIAAERAIGRDGNPTRAQHEYFERMGHSWNAEEDASRSVTRGEFGKTGAQQAALDTKRAKRLEALGLTGLEDLGL